MGHQGQDQVIPDHALKKLCADYCVCSISIYDIWGFIIQNTKLYLITI